MSNSPSWWFRVHAVRGGGFASRGRPYAVAMLVDIAAPNSPLCAQVDTEHREVASEPNTAVRAVTASVAALITAVRAVVMKRGKCRGVAYFHFWEFA